MANCEVCGVSARAMRLLKCSKCETRYCSKDCQKANWPTHRLVCGKLRDHSHHNGELIESFESLKDTPLAKVIDNCPLDLIARADIPTKTPVRYVIVYNIVMSNTSEVQARDIVENEFIDKDYAVRVVYSTIIATLKKNKIQPPARISNIIATYQHLEENPEEALPI